MSVLTLIAFFFVSFCGYYTLVVWESHREGRRILWPVRDAFDRGVTRLWSTAKRVHRRIWRYTATPIWYYLLHRVYRALLRWLLGTYRFLDTVRKRNRSRAKRLQSEKQREETKLDHVSAHKAGVSLNEEQKADLKRRSLEEY